MNAALRTVAVAIAAIGAAAAQADPAAVQQELQRSQRALQQNRSEIERLIDMRLRHDLGLGGAKEAETNDKVFRSAQPATTEAMEKLHQELRDEDAATASMQERYQKLKAAVEQLRADATARAKGEKEAEQAAIVVPVAGRQAPGTRDTTKQAVVPNKTAAPPESPAPAGETAPKQAVVDPATLDQGLDPMRAQIHGSSDHRRVAMALFRAGQALMDRAAAAREQQQEAVAKELDARGKERLQRVLTELAPLLQEKEPPLEALFWQGKALELLFRYSERNDKLDPQTAARDWQRREQEVRDAFLKITVRDVKKSGARGEVDVLGPWGQAAQAALEHFRWMNLHAGYDARPAIEALTWPGDKER